MFSVLHAGQLELFCLNFGEVILLPKVNEANDLPQVSIAHDIPQLSIEENDLLTTPYSEEEVKKNYFSNGTQ
jgi:hypothetical protein